MLYVSHNFFPSKNKLQSVVFLQHICELLINLGKIGNLLYKISKKLPI